MATNVAASALLLYDNWAGPISYDLPPADKNGNHFTNSTHHNVATAKYQIGTKIAYYDAVSNGWSTLIYLRHQADTHATATVLGYVATQFAGGEYYDVSIAGDQLVTNSLPAICLGVMTDAYFGWFWCSGVVPSMKTPLLTTTGIPTDGNVTADDAVSVIDAGTPDIAGFGILASTMTAQGWSTAIDA